MNAEQLNSARLVRWSQNGDARLTLEAATEWLSDIGFCPYQPMGVAASAPAPTFLEAVVGRPAASPSAGERIRAMELLTRLVENSLAVPLKLGSSLGEQPDFVASPDALRYIYALRGDRNFKTGPLTVGNEKVTPLSLHCWQTIEQQGPMDVARLQPILGRDITEAAIARALQELWAGLYLVPIYGAAGEAAQWELLVRRFPKPVAAGASTSHAEAQSAMLSLYLQASVAALEEEILAFLSPLAPQSKLREVIRGLGSMRQLDILDIGGRAHVALEGGLLPEMVGQLAEQQLGAPLEANAVEGEPEIAMEAELESEAEVGMEPGIKIEAVAPPPRRSWQSKTPGTAEKRAGAGTKKFAAKKFTPGGPGTGRAGAGRMGAGRGPSQGFAARSGGESRGSRPASGGRAGGSGYSPRPRNFGPSSFAASADKGEKRGGMRPERFAKSGFRSRASFAGDATERGAKTHGPPTRSPKGYAAKGRGLGERARRWQKSEEVPEGSRERKPFAGKAGGLKPFGSKPGGAKFRGSKPSERKFGRPSALGARPWKSKSPGAEGGGREEHPRPWKKFGAGTGEKAGFRSGSDKPYAVKSPKWKSAASKPRTGKPWAAKADEGGFSARGPRRNEAGEEGARPKPWQRSKGAESRIGSAKSFAKRSSGKPFAKAGGAKPWARRSAGLAGPAGSGDGPYGDAGRPKRRMEAEERSEAGSDKKAGAKPFWAKKAHGGKRPGAGSRSSRPHGKKTGGKSGRKK